MKKFVDIYQSNCRTILAHLAVPLLLCNLDCIWMPIYLEAISQYGVGGWIGETAAMRLQERQGRISNNAGYTMWPFEKSIIHNKKLSGGYYHYNGSFAISVFRTIVVWSIGISACSSKCSPSAYHQIQHCNHFEMWNKNSWMYTLWDILSNIWGLWPLHCYCCNFCLWIHRN